MAQTWGEWICEGSAWLPCGTWDEGGGWGAEHVGTWIGTGAELGAETVVDVVEAAGEAAPTVKAAAGQVAETVEGAVSVGKTVAVVAGIAVVAYGLSQVRGILGR